MGTKRIAAQLANTFLLVEEKKKKEKTSLTLLQKKEAESELESWLKLTIVFTQTKRVRNICKVVGCVTQMKDVRTLYLSHTF